MKYSDIKKAIIEDGNFLRESDNELLRRWFWAGVAAAIQVIQKTNNETYAPKKQCGAAIAPITKMDDFRPC